jgi:quinol-cytochrome oxidoreductase complex cytochrome b subunit
MKKIFLVLLLVLIVSPGFAFAQSTVTSGCSQDAGLGRCINQIYIWSMAAAAILALFMIVIGGYITLTAAGNASRASKGKEYIYSSLIGLVLLFGAFILLRTINPDLVDFSNNCANNITSCTTTKP